MTEDVSFGHIVMEVTKSELFISVLLAAASAGLICTVMKGGPRDGDKAVSEDSAKAAKRQADNSRSLPNGVYAVLREGLTREEVQFGKVLHRIFPYDRKYSESDKNEAPKYVALDTSFFVPLVLAGPPDTEKDDRGWTLLNVTLAREHVKSLENFTRVHLGGRVAIVVDGEIITMHKVRTVIQDGRAQITRCQDDACQTLRLKLAK
jgi:preprotein translocase subunit SecD